MMTRVLTPRRGIAAAVAAISLVAFSLVPSAQPLDEPVVWTDGELALIATLSPLPDLPASPSNRVADDLQAAQLGQCLFFDPKISKDGSVSCASCHKPSLYFSDGQITSVGLAPLDRHTPALVGSQWARFQFWDGRKDSLWSQALAPFEAEAEHGTTRLSVAHAIFDHYRDEYEELFGPLPPLDDLDRFPVDGRPIPGVLEHPHSRAWLSMDVVDRDAINEVFANVGKCIEAYERRLVPGPAPFDDYVADLLAGSPDGGGHISSAAIRGLRQFIGSAGCVNCHNGPLLTDDSFHNTGLPSADTELEPDLGRETGLWSVLQDPFRRDGRYSDDLETSLDLAFARPDFEDLLGAFRTPSLRNIAATAPYGHNGQIPSLEAMIEHYRRLPRGRFPGHRDLILRPLDDSVSTTDLAAFLETLTGPLPADEWLSCR